MMKRIAPTVGLIALSLALFVIAFATTSTQTATNISATGWTNPSNAGASDDTYATNTASNPLPLLAMDYGFALTSSDVIDSITARIEWYDPGAAITTVSMRLMKLASPVGDDNGGWSAIPSTETTEQFSGVLWGTTWAYTDVNSTQFGFRFDVTGDGGSTTYVDHCEISIYYHTVTTGTQKRIIGMARALSQILIR